MIIQQDDYINNKLIKELENKAANILRKPKKLKINVNEAILEGNLIELPFITYNRIGSDNNFVTMVEYNWVDSKGVKRGIEVRGSSKYGVPTAFDFDVLVSLLRVFVENNTVEYNQRLFDESLISDSDVEINFTFTQIARDLGYSRPNSKILEKIQISLERLIDTTIYNKFNGGIYDICTSDYITDEKEAFHILNYLKSYHYTTGEKRLGSNQIKQKVILNKFFYRSIANNYFKYFDYNKYTRLQGGISKKLYLLLNKWCVRNEQFKAFNLQTLYDRIPLDPSGSVKVKNQSLKRALESLVKVGYITDFEINSKTKKATLYFNKMVNTQLSFDDANNSQL